MKHAILAKRYVKAIERIIDGDKADVLNQLSTLINVITGHETFFQLLKSPLVEASEKRELIQQLVKKANLSDLIGQVLEFIVAKGRAELLPALAQQASEEAYHLNNEQSVVLQSPVELSAEHTTVLLKYLEDVTGKTIVPSLETDEDMIGGFRAVLNNTIYDGSVDNALESFKQTFVR